MRKRGVERGTAEMAVARRSLTFRLTLHGAVQGMAVRGRGTLEVRESKDPFHFTTNGKPNGGGWGRQKTGLPHGGPLPALPPSH